MPHYADGTLAKVGDHVVGKLYNTPGKVAGTIVSVTPGVESCNAMVAFTKALPKGSTAPRMALYFPDANGDPSGPRMRTVKGESHGSAGHEFDVYECVDYCATNELTRIE